MLWLLDKSCLWSQLQVFPVLAVSHCFCKVILDSRCSEHSRWNFTIYPAVFQQLPLWTVKSICLLMNVRPPKRSPCRATLIRPGYCLRISTICLFLWIPLL